MRFRPVQWFESLPSTNAYLRSAVERGVRAEQSGVVIAARTQTQGQGRGLRAWRMTPWKDLAFSFLIVARIRPESAPSVAMASALAVSDALRSYGITTQVKWPNDVRTQDGRKICGVLAQALPWENAGRMCIITGLGINVNSSAGELANVGQPAASIRTETGTTHPPCDVLDTMLINLASRLTVWESGGFAALRNDWLKRSGDIGRKHPLLLHGQPVTGWIEDFGPHGEALLRAPDGALHPSYLPEMFPAFPS